MISIVNSGIVRGWPIIRFAEVNLSAVSSQTVRRKSKLFRSCCNLSNLLGKLNEDAWDLYRIASPGSAEHCTIFPLLGQSSCVADQRDIQVMVSPRRDDGLARTELSRDSKHEFRTQDREYSWHKRFSPHVRQLQILLRPEGARRVRQRSTRTTLATGTRSLEGRR